MKHIAKYRGILRESEATPNAKIEDLRYLRDLNMIDQKEYVTELLKVAMQHSIDLSTLLAPGEMVFEIEEVDDGDEEISPGMREAMASFKGPKGEVPVWITGKVEEPYYDFEVTLSDGSIFRMYYRSFYSPQVLSLERGGAIYELDEEERNQVEEEFAHHADWSQYIKDVLRLLLNTANGK